jgi:hypothetical protein
MRLKILFSFYWFAFVLFYVAAVAAQTSNKSEPFRIGETLSYEGKFSKALLRGIDVADLNFTVERAPTDKRNFVVKADAKSKGALAKLINFDFNQNFQSTIDGEHFQILKTVKHDEQGSRVRDSEAIFDYRAKKVVYVETDPNETARAPRRVASAIENDTQDLVSAIYLMRRLPLAVGKTFELKISDSGLIFRLPVKVTARELQKTVAGRSWCYRVEPEIFGKNRLIEKEGSLIIWITDDARRLPVRAQINTGIGRVEVKLKTVK